MVRFTAQYPHLPPTHCDGACLLHGDLTVQDTASKILYSSFRSLLYSLFLLSWSEDRYSLPDLLDPIPVVKGYKSGGPSSRIKNTDVSRNLQPHAISVALHPCIMHTQKKFKAS